MINYGCISNHCLASLANISRLSPQAKERRSTEPAICNPPYSKHKEVPSHFLLSRLVGESLRDALGKWIQYSRSLRVANCATSRTGPTFVRHQESQTLGTLGSQMVNMN